MTDEINSLRAQLAAAEQQLVDERVSWMQDVMKLQSELYAAQQQVKERDAAIDAKWLNALLGKGKSTVRTSIDSLESYIKFHAELLRCQREGNDYVERKISELSAEVERLTRERDVAVKECKCHKRDYIDNQLNENDLKELRRLKEWWIKNGDGDTSDLWGILLTECNSLRSTLEQVREGVIKLRDDHQYTIDFYERNGPTWTSRETGSEYYDASFVQGKAVETIEKCDELAAIAAKESTNE